MFSVVGVMILHVKQEDAQGQEQLSNKQKHLSLTVAGILLMSKSMAFRSSQWRGGLRGGLN